MAALANPSIESSSDLLARPYFALRFMSDEERAEVEAYSCAAGVRIVDAGGRLVPIGAFGSLEARDSAAGAAARWLEGGMLDRAASGRSLLKAEEYVAPRDILEARLVRIWEDLLNVRPIGIRSNFFELGGYSLAVAHLFATINRVFGTQLPFTVLFRAPTIESLAGFLRQQAGRVWYSPLVPVQTSGGRTPLFMVHSYLLYDGLAQALGPDQPFYGLQEPPMEHRSPPYRLEDMVAPYIDAIREVQPVGPYNIAGWCAAGIQALEVARQLEQAGQQVNMLGLIDSWCPIRPPVLNQAPGEALRRRRPVMARLRKAPARLRAIAGEIREAAAERVWRYAAGHWIGAGEPLPHWIWNASRMTRESTRRYRPAPVHCPIHVFRAMEGTFEPYADRDCGWQPWTTSRVVIVPVPGDHVSMFLRPNLDVTAARIRECLGEAAIC